MALHDASMPRLMEARDLISRLVAIDSVNRTLVPGGAGEDEIAVFVLGRGSVHASLIPGGEELSSYRAQWVLSLERRTLPGETLAAVEAEVAARLCG
jgi:acetylornithine deacetylase